MYIYILNIYIYNIVVFYEQINIPPSGKGRSWKHDSLMIIYRDCQCGGVSPLRVKPLEAFDPTWIPFASNPYSIQYDFLSYNSNIICPLCSGKTCW